MYWKIKRILKKDDYDLGLSRGYTTYLTDDDEWGGEDEARWFQDEGDVYDYLENPPFDEPGVYRYETEVVEEEDDNDPYSRY